MNRMWNYPFMKLFFFACVSMFLLAGCNDNTPQSVSITAQPIGSSYYSSLINGPRYQVISVTNTSENAVATVNTLNFTGSPATSIVNRSNNSMDPAYGNYPQCSLTTNPNLLQISSLEPGTTCLLVLQGAIGDPTAPAKTGALTVQVNFGNNAYSKTFNLVNTTSLYEGGSLTGLGSATAGSNFLLAKCNGTSCVNFFGNGSTLGADGDIYGMTADPSGNLYVGGSFKNLGQASAGTHYLLAKCSNANCSNFFNNSNTLGADNGIFAMTTDTDGNLYVAGMFKRLGDATAGTHYLLAKCSNSTCSNFFDDTTSGANLSIATLTTDHNNTLYASGYFNSLGTANAGSNFLLAKCTNASCSNFFGNSSSEGANYPIETMAVDTNNNLYVGGSFTTLGTASAGSNCLLAKCTNASCTNFFGNTTSGANNSIGTIAIDNNDNLYVGGSFYILGSASASGMLLATCTNGACSNYFGNNTAGADNPITTIMTDTNANLYVSGSFGSLGNANTFNGNLLGKCTNASCINFFGSNDDLDGASGSINAQVITNQLTVTTQ